MLFLDRIKEKFKLFIADTKPQYTTLVDKVKKFANKGINYIKNFNKQTAKDLATDEFQNYVNGRIIKRSEVLYDVISSKDYETVNIYKLKVLLDGIFDGNHKTLQTIAAKELQEIVTAAFDDFSGYEDEPWGGKDLENLKAFLNDLEAHPTIAKAIKFDASINIPRIVDNMAFDDAVADSIKHLNEINAHFNDQTSRRYTVTHNMKASYAELSQSMDVLKKYMVNID